MRLIDADALKRQIQQGIDPHNFSAVMAAGAFFGEVNKSPTVDAAPVVRGHWIENEGCSGDSYYTCSACGCDWVVAYGTPMQNHMQYCPNCGAKMAEHPLAASGCGQTFSPD